MPPKSQPEINPLPAIDLEQTGAAAFLGALKRERIPSLLFTGPQGAGKELTALEFARSLCCERETLCSLDGDLCASCYKAARLEHPGIHLIYPTPTQGSAEGEDGDVADIAKVLDEKRRDVFARYRFTKKTSIRVARSRAVIQRANTKPFDSPFNIFIFVDAHTMREEAQNALLKIVEEPPAHSVLMFLTTNPESILYTIRSRCQTIRFSPLKPSVIETVLRDYFGVDANRARRASTLAQGSIDRARAMVESDAGDNEAAVAFVGELSSRRQAWAAGQALAMARGANREAVARFLDEMAIVFRDMMTGDPAMYVNSELSAETGKAAARWPVKELPRAVELIAEARSRVLHSNANIDGTLADLFPQLQRARG